jgi:endonuclease YncB( thermonuclease family)
MRTILRLWIFGLLMRALAPAAAADHLGAVPATVDRVIDGDTLKVSALIWIDQSLSVSVRIKGVDAPELFRPRCKAEKMRAREAKIFVEALVADGAVMLHDVEHDKYGGRVAARVTTGSGGDLGAALIAEGLAVEAGARDPWCG